MCDICTDALRNEQGWIDLALDAAVLLERLALALPADHQDRDAALSQVAAIRSTPMLAARKGPATRRYTDLHPTAKAPRYTRFTS